VVGAVELILLPCPAIPAPLKPYLFNLCVDPKFRNNGIGRKLVRACEQQGRDWGFDGIFLHVEDESILDIYTRLGYAATWQQPTFLELNLQNKLVVDYQPGSRQNGQWVIMSKDFADA